MNEKEKSAAVDAEERKKNCQCCRIGGTLHVIEQTDPRIFISVNGGYLQIFDESYPGFVDNVKINYCPICGRDLTPK